MLKVWSPLKYWTNIEDIGIEKMLETPFMLEIVVEVLPTMMGDEYNDAKIKGKILECFP